jgi:hypothetical protein
LHVALAVHLDAKTLRVRGAQVLAASAPKLRGSAARAESQSGGFVALAAKERMPGSVLSERLGARPEGARARGADERPARALRAGEPSTRRARCGCRQAGPGLGGAACVPPFHR